MARNRTVERWACIAAFILCAGPAVMVGFSTCAGCGPLGSDPVQLFDPMTVSQATVTRTKIDPNMVEQAIRSQTMGLVGRQDFLDIEAQYERLPGWRMGFAVDLDGNAYAGVWIFTPIPGSDLSAGHPQLLEP